MKGIPQGRYTREFRQEAMKLVIEEELSLPEAALSCLWLPQHSLIGSKPIEKRNQNMMKISSLGCQNGYYNGMMAPLLGLKLLSNKVNSPL